MDKETAVKKVREALGIAPYDRDGIAFFELNGIYLCHISGNEDYSYIDFRHSSTDTNCFDFTCLPEKLKDQIKLGYKAANVVVPDWPLVTLTEFDYCPGDKWECGHLNLTAVTPLGLFTWEEVIPGPRHSEDNAELTVILNDVEIDLWEHGIELDFEPPGKSGKWADIFADSEDEVADQLSGWFTANKKLLAALIA